MSTPSVSAVCPGCKETLRIPTSWADKAVKCKRCGAVVRATTSAPAPAQTRPLEAIAPVHPNPMDPLSAPTPAGTTPGYPGAPASYPYAPPGYGPPPGYPAVAPGYGPPPSNPAAVPGYGYGVPPGYPYAPPPGYGVPPGYPAAPPGYGPPAPIGDPFTGGFQDAPSEDGSRRFRREDEEDDRPRKRRYKKSAGASKWIVLGIFGAVLAGGGVVAALKWDSIKGTLGMKGTPKEKDNSTPADPAQPGSPAKAASTALTANPTFSRRMLFLSSTKYLYCNPLTDGVTMSTPPDLKQEPVAISELSVLARRIASLLKVPAGRENNQLYVVTDGKGNLDPMYAASRPMLKSIAEQTLSDFCSTCRPQDRVVIYFGGHALAADGKAYLVPANGDMQEIEGGALLPLETFWKTLAECPAQQKVVLFDVCRLNEDNDAIRPGSEPMSKELQDLLHAPPAGVDVVTACSEGQTAREFRRAPDRLTPPGSVFLHALRNGLKNSAMVPTPSEANEPIPVAEWVTAAQAKITERFGPKAQTLKFTAGAPVEVTVTDQPPPDRFAFVTPPKGADVKEVKAVFDVIALAPIKVDEDAREDTNTGESLAEVVFFPADALADYKTDMTLEEAVAAGDKFPVRAAAAKALLFIRDKWAKDKKTGVQTRFSGNATDDVKKEVKEKQIPFADLDVDFNELNAELEKAKEKLDQEKSKYWRAMFLYASAQTKARLAFVNEYNLILGRILTESLPEFNKDRGLQLVSVEKMESKKEYKQLASEAKETFTELIEQNKGTPWAVMAKQYRVVSLGLKWQEYKPPVMVEKDKDD